MLPKQADMCEHGVPIGFWKEFIQLTCDLFLLEMVYHFVLPYGFISDNIWWMENPMIAWREIRIQFSAWKSNFFFFCSSKNVLSKRERQECSCNSKPIFFFSPSHANPYRICSRLFFFIDIVMIFFKSMHGSDPIRIYVDFESLMFGSPKNVSHHMC